MHHRSHRRSSLTNPAELPFDTIFDQQMQAWNAGDAESYAQTFAEDATATNIMGDTYFGRPALAARMAEILNTMFKGSRLELRIRRANRIRDDVVIVDIDSIVHDCHSLPPAIATENGLLRSAMLQVLLRNNNVWQVAAFHNVVNKGRDSI